MASAMQAKIHALQNNETWEITDLPPDKNIVGCKWVYKIKRNFDGSIERYKARNFDGSMVHHYFTSGFIVPCFVASSQQSADIFTKPLPLIFWFVVFQDVRVQCHPQVQLARVLNLMIQAEAFKSDSWI